MLFHHINIHELSSHDHYSEIFLVPIDVFLVISKVIF